MARVKVIKAHGPVLAPVNGPEAAEWTAVKTKLPTNAASARREVRVNHAGAPYYAPSGIFAAEDFGAVADGTTDNATAFAALAAAVNAVPNPDGRPVPVRFTGNADTLAYRYSGGLVFTRPVIL